MHDTVIQGCASVSALLEAVSIGTGEPASKRELLDCARTQVRATVDEARRAVWNLRRNGALPEIGPLLGQMAQQAATASHVPVRFEASGKPVLLDPAVEHDILMVAREAVYNAVQHARATEVKMQVHFEHNRLRLRVADDGCGFNPETVLHDTGEHFGMVGMRERTARLGGNFNIRSAPGTGTELLVEVPVRSAAAERLGIGLQS
jgi:signal transduction histidine kinase